LKIGYSTICLFNSMKEEEEREEVFLSFEDHFSKYRRSVVEIFYDTRNPPFLSETRFATLREVGRSFDLEYSLHLPNYELENQQSIQTFTEAMNYVFTLECTHAVIHPGWIDPEINLDLAWGLQVGFLGKVGGELHDAGVQPVIENAPGNPKSPRVISNPERMERFFNEKSSRYYEFLLDIGHGYLFHDLDEYIDRLGDKTSYLHLHDNKGERDDHLALDKGEIDWRSTLNKLLTHNFDGLMVIEATDWEGNVESLRLLQSFLNL